MPCQNQIELFSKCFTILPNESFNEQSPPESNTGNYSNYDSKRNYLRKNLPLLGQVINQEPDNIQFDNTNSLESFKVFIIHPNTKNSDIPNDDKFIPFSNMYYDEISGLCYPKQYVNPQKVTDPTGKVYYNFPTKDYVSSSPLPLLDKGDIFQESVIAFFDEQAPETKLWYFNLPPGSQNYTKPAELLLYGRTAFWDIMDETVNPTNRYYIDNFVDPIHKQEMYDSFEEYALDYSRPQTFFFHTKDKTVYIINCFLNDLIYDYPEAASTKRPTGNTHGFDDGNNWQKVHGRVYANPHSRVVKFNFKDLYRVNVESSYLVYNKPVPDVTVYNGDTEWNAINTNPSINSDKFWTLPQFIYNDLPLFLVTEPIYPDYADTGYHPVPPLARIFLYASDLFHGIDVKVTNIIGQDEEFWRDYSPPEIFPGSNLPDLTRTARYYYIYSYIIYYSFRMKSNYDEGYNIGCSHDSTKYTQTIFIASALNYEHYYSGQQRPAYEFGLHKAFTSVENTHFRSIFPVEVAQSSNGLEYEIKFYKYNKESEAKFIKVPSYYKPSMCNMYINSVLVYVTHTDSFSSQVGGPEEFVYSSPGLSTKDYVFHDPFNFNP